MALVDGITIPDGRALLDGIAIPDGITLLAGISLSKIASSSIFFPRSR
jgi:hypothetical protein